MKKKLYIACSLVAVVISLLYSYQLRWIGDDIFIGFRYIRNFLAGNGLVYNVGERVEGYTDFLWLMLLSFFSLLKCNELITVQVTGILCSATTVLLFAVMGYKVATRSNGFILPFIAMALALNYDYNVWATSGLETSFYCFLLSASFYCYFFSALKENTRLLSSGFFICLAMLTRPDALLIAACANGMLAVNHFIVDSKLKERMKSILLFNLSILVIYVPYFIWRYRYYGFIFPNTYYDKLGYESNFKAGFYYIGLYLKNHFTSLLFLFLPPFILVPWMSGKGNHFLRLKYFLSNRTHAAFICCLVVVCVYLVGFVAKVGGDFMYARFIIPLAPFIYFIIFYAVTRLAAKKWINIFLSAVVLMSFLETKIRMEMFRSNDKDGKETLLVKQGVTDERAVYKNYNPVVEEIGIGKTIRESFKGIDAKLLIGGGQAGIGYYSDFSYCQEYYGLTDTFIAHSKVETRGRIGHEKHGSIEYFESKGIDFSFYVDPLTGDEFRTALIFLPSRRLETEFISYKTELVAQLKTRFGSNFQFTDFTSYLDNYIKNKLPLQTYGQLKSDYENFYLYYFKHNHDESRETVFLNAIKNFRKK